MRGRSTLRKFARMSANGRGRILALLRRCVCPQKGIALIVPLLVPTLAVSKQASNEPAWLLEDAISAVGAGNGETDVDREKKDVVELGRQVVTGSRIRRIDVEEARPVVVITREDIELSGRESVADVLRNNPVNTLGSSRERSGNSWIGQATINLHGIGANRTLVLLDGRRAPRSPVTANQAVDLNIIPLAAVQRIEILTDSASAIYGSDAIGGVVNIILRKDYEGIEVATSLDRPTREGADAESGALTLGGATDRSRFLFSADFRNKEDIASRDRFYTLGTTGYEAGAAAYPAAPFPATWHAWENADNVSSWGNTIWPQHLAAPNCGQAVNPATGQRLLAGPYVSANGDEHCGFHYAPLAWETTDLKRASVFLHADYELTPDHALRVQSLFSTQNVHGRFAPPPGDIALTEAAAVGLKRGFSFDIPYPELLPYTLRHRFAGMGDRDFKALLTLSENALLAYGSAGIFEYELEVRHTRYDGREDSCCFPKAFMTLQRRQSDTVLKIHVPEVRAGRERVPGHHHAEVVALGQFRPERRVAARVGGDFRFDTFRRSDAVAAAFHEVEARLQPE